MSKRTRILSIDGGGIRGIIPSKILETLELMLKERTARPDASIVDYFDLIAGTSAGGILTCLYLCPDKKEKGRPRFSAQDVMKSYTDMARKIFDCDLWRKIKSFNGYLDEKYPVDILEKALNEYFGDLKLNQLIKKCLITTYDLENRCSYFFTKDDAEEYAERNFFVKEVARATSAAPAYFEIAKITSMAGKSYSVIDGAMFANNPAMCAYVEAHKFEGNPTAKEMVILSLGTGKAKKSYRYESAREWGKLEWIIPAIDIMMSGVSETVDYQLKKVFSGVGCEKQYVRIDPDLDSDNLEMEEIDNASPKNVMELAELGAIAAQEHYLELHDIVTMLLENEDK